MKDPEKPVEARRHWAARCRQFLSRNRRFVILAIPVLFCALAVGRYVWLAIGPNSWGPRFTCTESYLDCGEIPSSEVVEHEFVIGNTGRQPLHILKAVPGCCDCLSVDLERNEIMPGGTSVLKVTLDVGSLEQGEFVKKVLVTTDDPGLSHVVLYVKGTVTTGPNGSSAEPASATPSPAIPVAADGA